ncbi:hypothetical protein BVRB_2g047740 [Beta vulgaris subsp. vulgaris]|nr:hypothetical protein BVRB_2g047740 [Beta vulgaris subsp. vulgaris]
MQQLEWSSNKVCISTSKFWNQTYSIDILSEDAPLSPPPPFTSQGAFAFEFWSSLTCARLWFWYDALNIEYNNICSDFYRLFVIK